MTPAPTVLGERYELLGVIGAGGFCEVWRARDRVLDRQVAVKLLDVRYARDPEALARFRAEAQNAGCLAHPNVARVYDFGEPGAANLPFLVMELVEGPTLADVLAAGPLEPARAMDVVAQAAAGLQAAHAAGLVHRDVKPGNLLLGPGGIVKVADFGISHAIDSIPLTGTGIVIGSPGYVAPERALGERASQASDLYALGVVAYECLTGGPPFEGTGLEIAIAHLSRPFPQLPPGVPAGIAALVARLTDKDPANRPASAGVVAEHAIRLRDQSASALAPAPEPPRGLAGVGRAAANVRIQARATRWRVMVAVAAAISALGIFLASGLNDPTSAHQVSASRPAAAQLGSASDAAARTVMVSRSLIGQPVARAVARLRGEGLMVHVIWRRLGGHRQGRVLSVRPLGQHRVHSTVTVTGARRPGRGNPGPRHQARSGEWSDGTVMSAPGPGSGAGAPARGPAKPHGQARGHNKPHGNGNGKGHGKGHGKGNEKGKGDS